MIKSNLYLKSIFAQISEQVFAMKDLNEVKIFVIKFVNSKEINKKDKQSILYEIQNTKSLVDFQRYLCNALLKFEGLGVNQINKTSREAASETSFD